MSIVHLLNETVAAQRLSRAPSGNQGGFTETLTGVGSFRARIRPLSQGERSKAGLLGVEASHKGYAAPGVIVQRDDIWTRAGGAILRVVATPDTSEPRHHREILLTENQAGV